MHNPFVNVSGANSPVAGANVSAPAAIFGYVETGAASAIVMGAMINTHTYNIVATYHTS